MSVNTEDFGVTSHTCSTCTGSLSRFRHTNTADGSRWSTTVCTNQSCAAHAQDQTQTIRSANPLRNVSVRQAQGDGSVSAARTTSMSTRSVGHSTVCPVCSRRVAPTSVSAYKGEHRAGAESLASQLYCDYQAASWHTANGLNDLEWTSLQPSASYYNDPMVAWDGAAVDDGEKPDCSVRDMWRRQLIHHPVEVARTYK
ncbi:hypothetical protein I350_07707 [Cryptococcus amylolentus CBS 6273]|uniref:Uncharacterized protein n=1 Tax=Cryptococcus amylolentus CBS 6273 TaxID=1296118 RepID=A0A1E3JBM8_9TREE|nr:hypothetical protein I350_07707 [Cryptococcus amylolentus CBS 6273]